MASDEARRDRVIVAAYHHVMATESLERIWTYDELVASVDALGGELEPPAAVRQAEDWRREATITNLRDAIERYEDERRGHPAGGGD